MLAWASLAAVTVRGVDYVWLPQSDLTSAIVEHALPISVLGWILLIVGILGIVLSMIFWSSWAGPGYWSGSRRRTTYVDEGPPPGPPGY